MTAEHSHMHHHDDGNHVCGCAHCVGERKGAAIQKTLTEMLDGLPEGSLEEFADYIGKTSYYSNGKRLKNADEGPITFTFDTFEFPDEYGPEDVEKLEAQKDQLREAMKTWETVANVEFQEVSGVDVKTVDITYIWGSAFGGGYQSGRVVKAGNYETGLHEVGHALGLGHAGNYNFDKGAPVFTNDSGYLTTMSYLVGSGGLGMVDILAIQNLYGPPKAENDPTTGDTVYGVGSNLTGGQMAGWGQSDADSFNRKPVFRTIYDRDGIDTVDLSDVVGKDMKIDLNDGGIIGNAENGYTPDKVFAVAKGTVIENVIAGYGDDTIVGNEADNVLNGGMRDDVLTGNGGRDSFRVSANWGRDRITDFEKGQDVIDFSASSGVTSMSDIRITTRGKDALISYGDKQSILVEGMAGKIAKDDIVFSPAGNDPTPSSVTLPDDSTYTEVDSWDRIIGSDYGHDTLVGGSGDDVLKSNGGDVLIGGAGDDEHQVGINSARIVLTDNWGNDTVKGANPHRWYGERNSELRYKLDFSEHSTIRSMDDLTITQDRYFLTNHNRKPLYVDVTIISDGQGNSVRLDNLLPSELSEKFFIFAEEETQPPSPDATPAPEDAIRGTDQSDELYGTMGDDFFVGSNEGDYIIGGAGEDTVSYRDASEGVDVRIHVWDWQNSKDWLFFIENLEGSRFDDTLVGDNFDNVLTGGAGADTFGVDDSFGNDTITDFEDNVDQISFSGRKVTSIDDVSISSVGGDAVISDDNGNSITVTGAAGQISENDLVF